MENTDYEKLIKMRPKMERARTIFGVICMGVAILIVSPIQKKIDHAAYEKIDGIDTISVYQSSIGIKIPASAPCQLSQK